MTARHARRPDPIVWSTRGFLGTMAAMWLAPSAVILGSLHYADQAAAAPPADSQADRLPDVHDAEGVR